MDTHVRMIFHLWRRCKAFLHSFKVRCQLNKRYKPTRLDRNRIYFWHKIAMAPVLQPAWMEWKNMWINRTNKLNFVWIFTANKYDGMEAAFISCKYGEKSFSQINSYALYMQRFLDSDVFLSFDLCSAVIISLSWYDDEIACVLLAKSNWITPKFRRIIFGFWFCFVWFRINLIFFSEFKKNPFTTLFSVLSLVTPFL